jgi:NADPH-dependent 7-cyano-7-deazaguanine reductase QueF-like protein
LNPLTKIKLGIKETELPTKSNWYIEWNCTKIYLASFENFVIDEANMMLL